MRIELGDFAIRPWRAGDEDALVRHANNRKIWINLRDRFPHPYTAQDAARWIQVSTAQPTVTNWAIEVAGEPVGGIGLRLQEDVDRVSAELGYWLGEPFWNRGIMSRAIPAMTAHGFATLSLTRIYALPFLSNEASQRVLEKAGYRREAVLRRSAIKNGEVLDQALYAITDLDFAAGGRLVR
jgi:RimJ/RimL family protein N-acetyltransferase